MVVLFCFVMQAVSYEYRRKAGNLLGEKTYNLFLIINGVIGTICIGAVVGSFFTGNPFKLGEMNDVTWMSHWRGIEVLFNAANLCLGLAIFFLSRTLASLYFMNNIKHDAIYARSKKQVLYNSIPFVVLLLAFLAIILPGKGYAIMEDKSIQLVPYKYFHNLLAMPLNTLVLLIGVIGVLFGIIKSILKPRWKKGIWFAGIGIVLAVIALFIVAGFNNTAFYPSYTDLNSSLTIYNASSSLYTLKTMAYVSLASPIVLWGVVLAVVNILVPAEWFWVIYIIQVLNLSGAAGDLYVSVKFSRLPRDILVQDYGIGMVVYSGSNAAK